MSLPLPELVEIAHRGLATGELPWLPYDPSGGRRVVGPVVFVRQGWEGPGFNFVAALHPPALPLPRIEEEARDFFGAAHPAWGVLVQGDAGHPIEDELRAAGWEVAEDEPAFTLADLSEDVAASPVDELDWILADRPDLHRLLQLLMARAFEVDPGTIPEAVPESLTDPTQIAVMALSGDQAVSGACGFLVEDIVHVAGVVTEPASRGRGFGGTATRRVLREALRRGARHAVLRSGPLSVPLYERLGFQFVCRHRTYAPPAGPAPA